MSAAHEAFLATPPQHQWTRSLQPLFHHLVAGSRGHKLTRDEIEANVFPCWVVLPAGCLAAMRELRGTGGTRLELRLARQEKLENPEKWEVEIAVFLRQWSIVVVDGGTPCRLPGREWIRQRPTPQEAGRTVARFASLLLGEIQPGKAQCAVCWAEDETTTVVPWGAAYGVEGQKCHAHAMAAGRPRENAPAPEQGSLL